MTLSTELPNVVVISGLSGSGKDTAADYLVDNYGYRNIKFATTLKIMLRSLYHMHGFAPEDSLRKVDGDLKDEPCYVMGGKTPREAMQTLGTEWGRDLIWEDLWVNITIQEIQRVSDGGTPVVITDARFNNEFDKLKETLPKASFVHIERPGLVQMTHVSESFVDNQVYDIYIQNIGDVNDLALTLVAALEDFQQDVDHWVTEEEED